MTSSGSGSSPTRRPRPSTNETPRGPMSDWDFATATARIAEARAFLDKKLEIEAAAGLLHLPVSPDLESAYESARDSFDLANRMADAETASLHALVTAKQAVDAPRAPL